jgi:branched-chain amino acid transport system substrate-binding protein
MRAIGRVTCISVVSAFLLCVSFIAAPVGQAAAKEVVIGVVGSLSGPGSEAYSLNTKGSRLAADWINQKGGITVKGEKYTLKLIEADAQGTIEGTVAAANKLVFSDKVKFIAGAMPPPPFVGAYSKIVEENKVFRVIQTALGISTELNSAMTYTVGTFPSTLGAFAGYDALVEFYPKAKRVAFICPEDPGAFEELENQKKLAAAHGLTAVVEGTHQFGAVDFYPMWTKILAAKPDVVIVHATIPQWGGSILKQGRELGYKGVFMVPNCNIDPNILAAIAGAYATDYIGVNYDPRNSATMTPEMKEMANLVKAKFGSESPMDYFVGIEGIWMLAQAIEHAQSLDPTVVRDRFADTRDFKTLYGPGKVGGKKHYGRDCTVFRPVQVVRIMDGKVQHVRWVTPKVE